MHGVQQRDVRKTLLRGCRVALHHVCGPHLVNAQTRAPWLMAWYKWLAHAPVARRGAQQGDYQCFRGDVCGPGFAASGDATGLGTALCSGAATMLWPRQALAQGLLGGHCWWRHWGWSGRCWRPCGLQRELSHQMARSCPPARRAPGGSARRPERPCSLHSHSDFNACQED